MDTRVGGPVPIHIEHTGTIKTHVGRYSHGIGALARSEGDITINNWGNIAVSGVGIAAWTELGGDITITQVGDVDAVRVSTLSPRNNNAHSLLPPIIANERDRQFLIALNHHIDLELGKVKDRYNPEQRYAVYKSAFNQVQLSPYRCIFILNHGTTACMP